MLGYVVAVEISLIRGGSKFDPLIELIGEWPVRSVYVVEQPEFHVILVFLFAAAQEMIAQLGGIGEVGHAPAIDVVFGHALFGEAFETVDGAWTACAKTR